MNDERLRAEGGPAFPVSIPGCGDNGQYGMTLRDYFAGQAIMALCVSDRFIRDVDSAKNQSMWAYEIADAMLAERMREKTK